MESMVIATTQKFYNQVEHYQRRKAATVIQALVGDEEKDKTPKPKEGVKDTDAG